MKKMTLGAMVCAALVACAGATGASANTTITFDERTTLFGTINAFAFGSGEFLFTTSLAGQFVSWGTDTFWNADPDGATVWTDANFALMQKTDDSAFSIHSIDIADQFNGLRLDGSVADFGPETVTFLGLIPGGGTVRQDFTISGLPGITTFDFDARFGNVVGVHWGWNGDGRPSNRVQLDNIVVGDPITVPEPGTWALMLGGVAMAGAMVRRRRSRLAQAT